MSNEKLEEREIESISRWTGIPAEQVRAQRAISYGEAIERFLSDESKAALARYGYKRDCESDDERLHNALSLIALIPGFGRDFYRTEEGKLWYECNVLYRGEVSFKSASHLAHRSAGIKRIPKSQTIYGPPGRRSNKRF